MAVLPFAFGWRMNPADCAAARRIAVLAQAGAASALSRCGLAAFAAARDYPEVLAAFELADGDYTESWLAPAVVHPALVTLLSWVPRLAMLDGDAAAVLAALYRVGGSPVAPRAPAGDRFHALADLLSAVFGPIPRDRPATVAHLGAWARARSLDRRLRVTGRADIADRLAPVAGRDLAPVWLVTHTAW